MKDEEGCVRYYFEGDGTLPFSLAEFDAPVSELASDRKGRLSDWLNGEVIIDGVLEPGVSVTGDAYVGSGSVIHASASIEGPVFIGKNCSIRHGALIRAGAVIADNCVVGHGAEIKNSVCMSGSKMQSGVFVGDSILGLGARLGSGTILANRRFKQDEVPLGAGEGRQKSGAQFFGAIIGDYARLGANVVTAPGTLVGPYTWVGSLASLQGFIPRAKLVTPRLELQITDKDETALRSGQGEYESI